VKFSRWFAAIAIVALVGGCSSGKHAASRPATVPDGQAARELGAAAQAMTTVPSYRFVATVRTQREVTVARGEFQAPDRVHQTIAVGSRPATELVILGTRVVVRDAPTGVWRDRQRGTAAVWDPRARFVALSRAAEVRKESGSYRFMLPNDAAAALVSAAGAPSGTVQGTAVVADGRIGSLEYSVGAKGRTVVVKVVYSDLGTAPAVAVPVPA
jgi:hypothetical protein